MALTDEGTNSLVMPVSPMYGGNNAGFGGDWAWIILLLLLGWGNNGFGGNNGGSMLYPWMNQADITTSGFQNAQLASQLTGIQGAVTSGFGDVQTALCSGFAGVNATVNGAQNAIAQQLYANTIADLERSYAAQTAASQGMTALQSQLAQCCCDNRLATANLQSVIAQENCADREALNYATRDIIAGQNAGIQRILDQMCQDKIDAKNEKIADLERQLTMANLAASQGAQTATLEQYLAPIPRPAYIVANPNGCNCGTGCGCGYVA